VRAWSRSARAAAWGARHRRPLARGFRCLWCTNQDSHGRGDGPRPTVAIYPPPDDSQAICATNPRIVMICAPPTRDRGMRLARARPSWWRRANSLGAQRALHAAIAAGDATRSSAVAAAAAPCGARCRARRRLCLPKRCRVVSGCFPVPAGTYQAPDALVCNWRRGRGQRAHMCSTRDRAGTRGYRVVPARHGVSARGFRRCPRQTRKASSLSHEDSFTSRKLPRLV
jgi:hypothetical protein